MAGGVAQVVRRKAEHYRVLSAVNNLSSDQRPDTITVNQIAKRARVTPDRAVQVLTRRYGRATRTHRRTVR